MEPIRRRGWGCGRGQVATRRTHESRHFTSRAGGAEKMGPETDCFLRDYIRCARTFYRGLFLCIKARAEVIYSLRGARRAERQGEKQGRGRGGGRRRRRLRDVTAPST
jgi:hypothetical protein